MPGPYTVATLRGFCQRDFQDTDGDYMLNADWLALFNEIEAQFARETLCIRTNGSISIVGGTHTYALTGLSPKPLHVYRFGLPTSAGGTDDVALPIYTLEQMNARDRNWRNAAQGQPECVIRFGEGFDNVRLWPTPSGNFSTIVSAGAALTMSGYYGIIGSSSLLTDAQWDSYYGLLGSATLKVGGLSVIHAAAPIAMTADGDYPSIPFQYQEALYHGALARACEMDLPIAVRDQAPGYWAKYADLAKKAKALASVDFQTKQIAAPSVEWF